MYEYYNKRGVTTMELIEVITTKENLNRAYKKVVENKGAAGIDEMTVKELGDYIRENKDDIISSLRNRTYMPKPVRRVYIPKSNGKKRPLGIPTVLDRTIQQAIAQPISEIYENVFSETRSKYLGFTFLKNGGEWWRMESKTH